MFGEPKVSFKSDIWSLACTVVELLTGHPPFKDEQPTRVGFQIVKEDILSQIPSGISEDLQMFLKSSFERQPELRPSADQLLQHSWMTRQSNEMVRMSFAF